MRERIQLPPGRRASLWRYTARPPIGVHCHDVHEFNLVVRGTIRYLVAERRYDLKRHSLIWLHPDQEHVLVDPSPDCEVWMGVIEPELLARVAVRERDRILHRNPPWIPARPLAPVDSNRLDQLFAHLHKIDDPDHGDAGLAYAWLDAWAAFDRADSDAEHQTVDPDVDLAARLLGRADAPERLEDLARRVGLSSTQLSRRFLKQLGVGIVDYRNRARLERFLGRYVPGGRESLLESALAAGFGSYPQFNRVFREVMGMSPRAYWAGNPEPPQKMT